MSIWDKLMKKWPGKVYQNPNKSVRDRFKYIKEKASLFNDMNVLDVGCNAALFSIPIRKYAKYYLGIEKEKKYFKQAVITIKSDPDASVLNIKISDLIVHGNFRGIILSRVLYYFTDEELKEFKIKYLDKAKVVIVICGSKEKAKKCNSWAMWKAESVLKYLQGFECELKWSKNKKYFYITGRK